MPPPPPAEPVRVYSVRVPLSLDRRLLFYHRLSRHFRMAGAIRELLALALDGQGVPPDPPEHAVAASQRGEHTDA